MHQAEAHRHQHEPHEQVQAAEHRLRLTVSLLPGPRAILYADRGERHEAEVDGVREVPAGEGGEGGRAQTHVADEEEDDEGRRHRRRGGRGKRGRLVADQGDPRWGVVAVKVEILWSTDLNLIGHLAILEAFIG